MWGWILLLALVLLAIYFFFVPRNFQTLENDQSIITKEFRAETPIDTTEDPTDLDEIGQRSASAASGRPLPGPNEPQQ